MDAGRADGTPASVRTPATRGRRVHRSPPMNLLPSRAKRPGHVAASRFLRRYQRSGTSCSGSPGALKVPLPASRRASSSSRTGRYRNRRLARDRRRSSGASTAARCERCVCSDRAPDACTCSPLPPGNDADMIEDARARLGGVERLRASTDCGHPTVPASKVTCNPPTARPGRYNPATIA